MHQMLSTPAEEAANFEADSFASTSRTGSAANRESPLATLRSFALILARCGSAATLLGWRKQITPGQKCLLDAAIVRLQEAAAQVTVRPSVPYSAPKRAKRGPLFRTPRS